MQTIAATTGHATSSGIIRRLSPEISLVSTEGLTGGAAAAFDRAFAEHLLRLSPACRRSRFGNLVGDDFIEAYAARFDVSNTLRVGCFIDGVLSASAEVRSFGAGWTEDAEIAFTVEERWQGLGLGAALMTAVLAHARRLCVRRAHLICSAKNVAMQRLAEKNRARMSFEEGDCIAVIALD